MPEGAYKRWSVLFFQISKTYWGTSAYKSGLEKIFFQKIEKITKKLYFGTNFKKKQNNEFLIFFNAWKCV